MLIDRIEREKGFYVQNDGDEMDDAGLAVFAY
jgi:hypothetical protein